jgi:hypothetical protein
MSEEETMDLIALCDYDANQTIDACELFWCEVERENMIR